MISKLSPYLFIYTKANKGHSLFSSSIQIQLLCLSGNIRITLELYFHLISCVTPSLNYTLRAL